jgi:iron complex transport system ATP-binding protein
VAPYRARRIAGEVLNVSGLSFAYGSQPVLRDVSLTVGAGDMVGVLGPNGCGKTTLLRLLAGSLAPQRGHITIDGRALDRLDRRMLARRIAVVPQHTQLAFDYSVMEVALMGRYPHLGAFEVEGPDDLAAARDALAATGTDHLADRPFTTLSGGEQQRVAIASALAQLDVRTSGTATATRFLLLDEPTASLDLRYQVEIAALVARLHDEALESASPLSIVTSTHDLRFASTVCTSLVLLAEGRVLATGAPDAVLTPEILSSVYGLAPALTASLIPARIHL